ncbi:MAG: FAD-binding oxidoreductase [Gammaproteobacteria bacterium]|nr:MAG: FAD-binding oxidoreductase [Gammaproteobacteria bacterium]
MQRKLKKPLMIVSIIALLILAILMFRIANHLTVVKIAEDNVTHITLKGYSDDASQLNQTKVHQIIPVKTDKQAIIKQLQDILKTAKADNLKVSLAGAKHSMGGHTMYPDGIVINMLPYKHMSLDSDNNILTIGSGALWQEALHYLDGYGKSVARMQAFSSFSVGGSISVNGHGWQKNMPPISSSVISFDLMTHDGNIITCSRDENAELFSLVMGGYGLFGIILDVRLQVVDNVALEPDAKRLDTKDYLKYYQQMVTDNPNANLAFGRLRISDKNFLQQATITVFKQVDKPIPSMATDAKTEAKRLVFRGSVNNEYGKRLRWDLENIMNSVTERAVYSRNEILNSDVSLIKNKNHNSTDILHEYFIPQRHFYDYIADIKPILQASDIDLMNITIRAVNKDEDSFLNYAREDVFGFVFLFNQQKDEKDERAMQQLTQKLVNIAINNEGTYYLPYRLHVDKQTMRKSYPQADEFFSLKLKYDPDEVFSNQFYQHYK